MPSGPKPKPTRLKLVEGNPGKRPLNANEPKPEIELPECPDTLSDEAKAQWDVVVAQLYKAKIITKLDGHALAMYCEAYARWVEANEQIRDKGLLVMSPSRYPMQTPYLAISNKAFDQMKAILTEFGMTPSSRTRVTTTDAPNSGDGWDEF